MTNWYDALGRYDSGVAAIAITGLKSRAVRDRRGCEIASEKSMTKCKIGPQGGLQQVVLSIHFDPAFTLLHDGANPVG